MLASLFRALRRTAPALVLLGLAAFAGHVQAQAPSSRALADTPQICDTLPHTQIGNLSGTWSNDGESVTLTHVGSTVTGIASYTEGGSATYTGCFDGTTFYLGYSNEVDDGYAELTLSADGNTLQGFWYSYEDNSGHHSWTLQRQ